MSERVNDHEARAPIDPERIQQADTPPARRWGLLVAIVAVVLLIDQTTKRLVVDRLVIGQSIPVIPPLFQITSSRNTGAAFGFLPQAGDVFFVVAIVITIALIAYYPRLPNGARLTRIGIGMVIGGALGNVIDRVEYGAVVDFIHYTIPGVLSNVSNLADHAIVFGVFAILIESWRTPSEKPTVSE